MDKAPIAFFVYNRPEHTRRALESLAQCEGAVKSELFIFCDGPKQPEDEEAVRRVRTLVKSRQWCGKVNIIERDENRGLADSIIAGVTEIVNRYGRIIVLEDDLVLSSQFLNYMNDALEIYKDVSRVMHISAYMFPVTGEPPDTFFYRVSSCWGWATWKRAWDKFEADADKLLNMINARGLKKTFDIEGSIAYYEMLKAQSEGKLDSWAVRWYASVFLLDGLCLHSGKSLVLNIGHDGSGIHCDNTGAFSVKLIQKKVTKFTNDIIEDKRTVTMLTHFFLSLKKPIFPRIIDRVKLLINCW